MRVVRGVVSLVVLLAGLVGVPLVLVVLGRGLLPETVSWSSALTALFRPDDGSVVLGLLLVVAWIAWLIFAVSALTEVIGFASGYRIAIRLPGLGGPQRWVAGLLLGVVAMVSVPQPSMADPTSSSTSVPQGTPGAATPVAGPSAVPGSSAGPAEMPAAPRATPIRDEPDTVVHTVTSGDDLWSLAERYYGSGSEWRRIAAANPERLTGGPDRLGIGWRLRIPAASGQVRATSAAAVADRVRVRAGDTLSSVAERHLGDADRWPELFAANRHLLDDPDELAIGTSLVLPVDGGPSSRTRRPAAQPSPPPTTAGSERAPGAVPGSAAGSERGSAPSQGPITAQPPSAVPTPAAPTSTVPTSAVPTSASATSNPRSSVSAPSAEGRTTAAEAPTAAAAPGAPMGGSVTSSPTDGQLAGALAGVGTLLAAGFAAGLVARRRLQLQARPLGRRILHPGSEAQQVEAILGRRARPLTVRSLDLALRAVAAHAFRHGDAPPRIESIVLGEDGITLAVAPGAGSAPPGFVVDGATWRVEPRAVGELREVSGLVDAPRPYPALVTVGHTDSGEAVLLDLESTGLLALQAEDAGEGVACLTAMATELAFSPWADEMFLTLVGGDADLPEALGRHNVSRTDDVPGLLDRLAARAAEQRRQAPDGPTRHRIDPDLADPWAPEVLLVADPLSLDQAQRLHAIITGQPSVTIAAVLLNPIVACPATLRLPLADETGVAGDSAAARGSLEPSGLALRPQSIGPSARPAVVELVRVTGEERTTPAPWWPDEPPDPPPDNVAFLSRRAEAWAGQPRVEQPEEVARMITAVESDAAPHHPVLRILGPVELDGATGSLPPRAGKQCLEYCGWLLDHPGSTAPQMAAALAVAEGTRRSNMSRLRTWLGSSTTGEPYLPDAYTGRITLHVAVSSDWQWLQIFTAGGVQRASDDALHAALGLVRGAPLADAAPGQWHWAEELRTDMISAVRDIGVELARRSLADGDIDGARWAAARALLAAPGDELLMVARIRTEHRAGNRAEVERLTLQVAAQARQLGVDLTEETVVALQEVMEGRARARFA